MAVATSTLAPGPGFAPLNENWQAGQLEAVDQFEAAGMIWRSKPAGAPACCASHLDGSFTRVTLLALKENLAATTVLVQPVGVRLAELR